LQKRLLLLRTELRNEKKALFASIAAQSKSLGNSRELKQMLETYRNEKLENGSDIDPLKNEPEV
jgi:hypothetical protein